MKKKIALLMAMVMLFGMTVAGTLAWLQAETDPVVNTFTVGDINITLDEAKVDTNGKIIDVDDRGQGNKYDIIPGNTYDKDPKVTVLAGSEPCYLFVKITETGNPSTYFEYTSGLTYATYGWTKLDGVEGVYWKAVDASSEAKEFPLLVGNTIKVKETVTKGAVMTAAGNASIEWKAYAVQSANMTDAKDAWTKANFAA